MVFNGKRIFARRMIDVYVSQHAWWRNYCVSLKNISDANDDNLCFNKKRKYKIIQMFSSVFREHIGCFLLFFLFHLMTVESTKQKHIQHKYKKIEKDDGSQSCWIILFVRVYVEWYIVYSSSASSSSLAPFSPLRKFFRLTRPTKKTR